MSKIVDFIVDLQYVFRPTFWISNEPTCMHWDKELRSLMDNAKRVVVGNHTTNIDGVQIWTSNYPYSYGKLYLGSSLLPSRRTRERLKRFVMDHSIKNSLSYERNKVNLICKDMEITR